MRIRNWTACLCLIIGVTAPVSAAQVRTGTAETIAIIGTGEVGGTLGRRWAAAGHRIVYGSRAPDSERVRILVMETGGGAVATTPGDAVRRAEIILLAVPWGAVKETVASLGALSGKIVVDPINHFRPIGGYPGPLDGPSVAQQLQSFVPGAKVVKAFNTLGSEIMADPRLAGGPVTIPLAGDDRDAKARVGKLIRDVGLEPMDMGPLTVAAFIEGMLGLYVSYRKYNPGQGFEFYMRPMQDIINSGQR